MIKDLVELLSNYNIEVINDADHKLAFYDDREVIFYDADNHSFMESRYTSCPVVCPNIDNNKVKVSKTISDLEKPEVYTSISSANKSICYYAREAIKGTDEKKLCITEFIYQSPEKSHHVRLRFTKNGIILSINSRELSQEDNSFSINKEITVYDDNQIELYINNSRGYYSGNTFYSSSLSADEIAKEIDSNELLTIFGDYYATFFKTVERTINTAKTCSYDYLTKIKRNH